MSQGGYGSYGGGGGGDGSSGSRGARRFLQSAAIGGAIGGVLSSIPFINVLNCCCLLNIIGAVIAVGSYLRSHPGENITGGDATLCGVIAGAIAGVISTLLGVVYNIIFGTTSVDMSRFSRRFPPDMAMILK